MCMKLIICKQLKKFIAAPNANRRCAPAFLFLPLGSSESPTPARAEGASLLRIFNKDLTRVLLSVFFDHVKKKSVVKRFLAFFSFFFTYGSRFSRILFSETSRTVWIFHVDFFLTRITSKFSRTQKLIFSRKHFYFHAQNFRSII